MGGEKTQEQQQPAVTNEISDETGQYDARFMLWRKFCAENNIPVDTLPSQLEGDQKDQWEKVKENKLR